MTEPTGPAATPEPPEQLPAQQGTRYVGQEALPLDLELQSVTRSELHLGPLPPAAELAAYDDVAPGLADRIVRMAESEQQHRHRIEAAECGEPFRLARRGQVIALVVVVLVLAFGVFLVINDAAVAGAVLVGIDLIGLVTVFVTGQRSPRPRDGGPGPDDDEPEQR